METLQLLIATRLKQTKASKSSDGFTLIEILVALVMGALVITPLLGLAVSLLRTDRQEQAKATSEQEIQAAADFIARDLQQAVFIYDPVNGLNRPSSNVASQSGIKNQIPPVAPGITGCTAANCTPVLAFWKRRKVEDAVPRDSLGANGNPTTNCQNTAQAKNCDDTFVYALVVYYLVKNPPPSNNVWSNTARIARFEISDGVQDLSGKEIVAAKSKKVKSNRFQQFDLTVGGASIAEKMNQWKPDTGTGTYSRNDMQVLVDYVDQSTATTPLDPLPTCPPTADGWNPTQNGSPGFFACVNTEKNIAKVFLRGNARARIVSNAPTYKKAISSYFPTATAEVRGVGELRE